MQLVVMKKMNKLLVVEDRKKIETGEYEMDTCENAHIIVSGEVVIHEYEKETKELRIDIENHSRLTFYQVKQLDQDYHIHICLKNEAIFQYHMLILNRGKHKVTIDVEMNDCGSKANVSVRTINLENHSNLDVVCNGVIGAKTIDNELLENLKGLIIHEDDSIKISPIMMVDTNEVMANHLVTIGTFDKEELFYLKQRGLSEELAKKLLMDAFLTNIMSDFEKEKIKMEVKEYE